MIQYIPTPVVYWKPTHKENSGMKSIRPFIAPMPGCFSPLGSRLSLIDTRLIRSDVSAEMMGISIVQFQPHVGVCERSRPRKLVSIIDD